MRPLRWLPLAGALLVAGVSTGHGQEPVQVTEQGVQVDFQDVDIRFVLSALAEAARLNLSYGDLPARRVTLRMTRPVAREQIPALLRSLAQSNGLRLIEEADLVRVEVAEPGAARAEPAADTAAEAEMRLYVHRLKHARAPRLSATLQAVFGGGRQQPGLLGQLGARPQAPLSERLREQRLAPAGRDTVARAPADVAVVGPSLPAQLRGEVQIVPDEATNSLLVRAQPGDWEVVRQAIEAMDLRPLQVLIEVVIAEVRRTSTLDVGVSARATRGADTGTVGTGGITGALRVARTGQVDVDVMLNALASSGNVRILSRPVLLAQNNQEARILIGSERPFVQVFRSLATDAGVRDQVVQYRDVGTSLSIVPTINDDGYVNLQVVQEVSTATAETQFNAPVISTREASTHLFLRNGQTAVLGGLMDREESRNRSGVPLLKDIPLVGMLFGSTQHNTTQSELFLFITPHVIATDDDTDRIRQGIEDRAGFLRDTSVTRPVVPRPPPQPPPQRP